MASTTAPGLRPAPGPAPAGASTAPAPSAGRSVPAQATGRSVPAQPAGRSAPAQPAGRGAPAQAAGRSVPAQPAGRSVPAQAAGRGGGPAVPGTARADAPAVPAHMLPHRSPAQLMIIARSGLEEAAHTAPDGLRYAAAHLAALRAAAALLAARARPSASGRRSRAATSVWALLVMVAPEFSDWAGYFALGAGKRPAAEAGIPHVVSAREADDLLRAAEQFVTVVEGSLGLTYQPPLAA